MSWDKQEEVEEFVEVSGLEAEQPFRLLDLVSEVGEVVKDATKSADYGLEEEKMEVPEDEVGDVLFSLLVFCSSHGIDAEEALGASLEKYRSRIDEKGDPGSS